MRDVDQAVRTAVLCTLGSAVAIDGEPTGEQRRLLDAVAPLLGQPGWRGLPAMAPEEAATAIVDPDVRRLVAEGLVTLELMCHRPRPELVDRIDGYLVAIGYDGPDQVLVRDAVAGAREQVAADWERMRTPSVSDPAPAVDRSAVLDEVASLASCAPGTLGHAFHEFCVRNGFTYTADHLSLVGHDFAHVLTGYEPVPEGELALQAFLVAAPGGSVHASGLLASLLLFEVGMLPVNDIEPKVGVLERPGAAALFADAVERGWRAPSDIQALDHLALAHRDLAELRAELAITPPAPGPFTWTS